MSVPCPPDVNIEVTVKRWQDLTNSLYYLQLTIGATTSINKNLFVFKQLLDRDVTTGCFISEFEAVATLPAIAEFAVDIPNEGQVFFRKNTVTLSFTSVAAAEETEALIMADLTQLVADAKASLSTFQSETVVLIPGS